MSAAIGAEWTIHHLTDRVVELRKDTVAYRQVTGRPGFVLVRGEPGMARDQLVQQAVELAHKNDHALAEIIANRIAPKRSALAAYQGNQIVMARPFATPEDPAIIGVKRA